MAATTPTTPRAGRLRREGFVLWFCATAGIWIWTAHAVSSSVLASAACDHHAAHWVQHVVTGVTAVATLAATVVCWRVARGAPVGVGPEPDEPTRLHFIGWFGVLVDATSLLLILWEGIYLPFLGNCGGR